MISSFTLTLLLAAAQPADGGAGSLIGFLLPLLLIFVVFYFFIIRPQKKREQKHQEMVNNVKKGDKIVTIGGIHGTINRVDEDSVLAQVDSNTKLRIDKNAIANVGAKNE